ncbi:DUF447 domain-containing protein [Hansschlegelia plantiphila]|uniref:DUF447 family protein n=1 Tax=Hansschlegelia plantiphila TaxID=374655 RepID=A0A9W6J1L9_9HYPH|nr:DUF447 domain-containing protein [Hansschlegelia plantiphila]GLK69151.1 hypothetical protein GCM10008179_27890 [Hansschlegelia plantiphila]
MIRETIVTTLSPQGIPHVAPMGATQTGNGWLLQPFRPSTTLDNFLSGRCGVINFTDDARIFAGCVTKRKIDWPTVSAGTLGSVRLEAALASHEVRIARIEDDGQRPKLHCEVVAETSHRAFPGLNRAIAAVVEGAVLVSRLRMLPPERIDAEFAYLQIAIDRTAGPAELEAWGWILDAVRDHRAKAAS